MINAKANRFLVCHRLFSLPISIFFLWRGVIRFFSNIIYPFDI